MNPSRKNFAVGLVVLVAMAGLAWMILKITHNSAAFFNRGPRFTLVADRADGVAEGSPVHYLGVEVGRVLSIQLNPDHTQVSIDATLNTGQKIPANVAAVIKAESALGSSAQIELEPAGPPGNTYLQNGQIVQAVFGGSGIVPPEVVAVATQVRQQQLIKHLDESIVAARVELDKVGKLLDTSSELLSDPKLHERVRATLASVQQTSGNMERFSARLDRLASEMSATLQQVRQSTADGGKRIDDLSGQVTQRMQQLADLLTKLDQIAGKIDHGNGTAALLVNDPRLYQGLVDSSRDMDLTFKDMQRLVDQWEQEGFSLKLK